MLPLYDFPPSRLDAEIVRLCHAADLTPLGLANALYEIPDTQVYRYCCHLLAEIWPTGAFTRPDEVERLPNYPAVRHQLTVIYVAIFCTLACIQPSVLHTHALRLSLQAELPAPTSPPLTAYELMQTITENWRCLATTH